MTDHAPGEDGGAIVLSDTRTHRSNSLTLDHERQFLVGNDEDEDEEALPPPNRLQDRARERNMALEEDVRSFSSNASMDSSPSASLDSADGRLFRIDRRKLFCLP